MPELPEVETIARELSESDLIGKSVAGFDIFWYKTLATGTAENFRASLKGQSLTSASRRGKFLLLTFNSHTLLIHLRMTGRLSIVPTSQPIDQHERARLIFTDNLALQFIDTRKFGRWYLHQNGEAILSNIGIEPLSKEFTLKALTELLHSSSTRIKPFLLNQAKICGIGNIYADEALWDARIHPETPANKIPRQKAADLHKAIITVLSRGVENMGTRLGSGRANYYSIRRRANNQDKLQVFRRDGLPCPRCGTTIARIVVAQRSTHYCPSCQTAGT